jgi:hypothetical protein
MLRTGLLLLLVLAAFLGAQNVYDRNDGDEHGDPPYLVEPGWRPLFNAKDYNGWHGQDPKQTFGWITARAIAYERLLGPTRLEAAGGPGDRMLNGSGRTVNLVTDEKFGDSELYLEFMLSKGSNSGVYLHGLYEVQIFDSFGTPEYMVKTSDCGAIYHRWINEQGVGGSRPIVNASRAPGQWQSFHIWFQGPRFDDSGKKTQNAKFVRVLHNGVLIQKDVEVDGGTRAHMPIPEAATNPIMLQGDHGPVAFRNIYIRQLRPIVNR